MIKLKKNIAGFSFLLLLMLMTFFLAACSQHAPTAIDNQDEFGTSDKTMKRSNLSVKSLDLGLTDNSEPDAPEDQTYYSETGSGIASWWDNKEIYKGTGFDVPNGSSFGISNGALTAPAGTPYGQDIEIFMTIARDPVKNEHIVSFGPHGCNFDPPAEVCINWSDIGTAVPNLYYIDPDKGYVQQEPDAIYVYEKKMLLYISHFSRYAVAYSD